MIRVTQSPGILNNPSSCTPWLYTVDLGCVAPPVRVWTCVWAAGSYAVHTTIIVARHIFEGFLALFLEAAALAADFLPMLLASLPPLRLESFWSRLRFTWLGSGLGLG